MITNINNDEIKVINTRPAVVEKVSPVPAAKAISAPAEKVSQATAPILGQSDSVSQPVSDKVLDETVRGLNEHMKSVQRELHFSVDEDSGRTVIKVMDLATQKIIRQIPNEEALNVARKLDEGIDPALFNAYS